MLFRVASKINVKLLNHALLEKRGVELTPLIGSQRYKKTRGSTTSCIKKKNHTLFHFILLFYSYNIKLSLPLFYELIVKFLFDITIINAFHLTNASTFLLDQSNNVR